MTMFRIQSHKKTILGAVIAIVVNGTHYNTTLGN